MHVIPMCIDPPFTGKIQLTILRPIRIAPVPGTPHYIVWNKAGTAVFVHQRTGKTSCPTVLDFHPDHMLRSIAKLEPDPANPALQRLVMFTFHMNYTGPAVAHQLMLPGRQRLFRLRRLETRGRETAAPSVLTDSDAVRTSRHFNDEHTRFEHTDRLGRKRVAFLDQYRASRTAAGRHGYAVLSWTTNTLDMVAWADVHFAV